MIKPILALLVLGVLCGYPLGVKMAPTPLRMRPEPKLWRITYYDDCSICINNPTFFDHTFADNTPVPDKRVYPIPVASDGAYPFGTLFHIESLGQAIVKDRGSAIKGR